MNEGTGKRPFTRRLFTVVLIVAVLGTSFSVLLSYPRGSATGEIRSTGEPHGDFVVRPVTCYSGGHWGFTGVWVAPETTESGSKRGFKGGLKIRKNEAGAWEAYVENPNACKGFDCTELMVRREYCKVFDVVVEDRNVWLRYDGHARMVCDFPEGGTLKSDLAFRGCAVVHSYTADP